MLFQVVSLNVHLFASFFLIKLHYTCSLPTSIFRVCFLTYRESSYLSKLVKLVFGGLLGLRLGIRTEFNKFKMADPILTFSELVQIQYL